MQWNDGYQCGKDKRHMPHWHNGQWCNGRPVR